MSAPDLGFLKGMSEKLGYYVYALRDPKGGIFYVGKGKGNRVYQHAVEARVVAGERAGQLKLNTIKGIHEQGRAVGIEIIRHNLSEQEAFKVEGAVMDTLRLTGHHLTNVAGGKGTQEGHRPLEALRAEYAAPPIKGKDRVMLVRINRAFRLDMSTEELYTVTREWWRLSPHHKPDYAFAVYGGIVRAVYAIDPDGWEREHTGRWRFSGKRDLDVEKTYGWRDVSAYWTAGAQNPIRFVNC
jgi:uncharacterized protein